MEEGVYGKRWGVFDNKRGPKPADHSNEDVLYGEIGRLKMELDWLKKVRLMNMGNRTGWVEPSDTLTLVKPCELVGVSRATWYNRQTFKPACEEDLRVSLA